MAAKFLQSLAQRVVTQTGVRATGLDGKGGYSAVGPIATFLSSRSPRADFDDADHEPDGCMEAAVAKRAGRPVRPTGLPASPAVARSATRTWPTTTWAPAAVLGRPAGCPRMSPGLVALARTVMANKPWRLNVANLRAA